MLFTCTCTCTCTWTCICSFTCTCTCLCTCILPLNALEPGCLVLAAHEEAAPQAASMCSQILWRSQMSGENRSADVRCQNLSSDIQRLERRCQMLLKDIWGHYMSLDDIWYKLKYEGRKQLYSGACQVSLSLPVPQLHLLNLPPLFTDWLVPNVLMP